MLGYGSGLTFCYPSQTLIPAVGFVGFGWSGALSSPKVRYSILGIIMTILASCVEGAGMRMTACDTSVMTTEWPYSNVLCLLHWLCLDISQDDATPSVWASKGKLGRLLDSRMGRWKMGKGALLVCCGSGGVQPLTGFGHNQVFLVVVAGVDACRVALVVGIDAWDDVHGLSRPFRIKDSLPSWPSSWIPGACSLRTTLYDGSCSGPLGLHVPLFGVTCSNTSSLCLPCRSTLRRSLHSPSVGLPCSVMPCSRLSQSGHHVFQSFEFWSFQIGVFPK